MGRQGGREHVVGAGSQGQACTPCVLPPGHPASPSGPVPKGSSLCRSDNKHSNSFSSFSHSCPFSGFSIREIRKSLHHHHGRARQAPQKMGPLSFPAHGARPCGVSVLAAVGRAGVRVVQKVPGDLSERWGQCRGGGHGPWAQHSLGPACVACGQRWSLGVPPTVLPAPCGVVSRTSLPAQGHAGPFSGPSLHSERAWA